MMAETWEAVQTSEGWAVEAEAARIVDMAPVPLILPVPLLIRLEAGSYQQSKGGRVTAALTARDANGTGTLFHRDVIPLTTTQGRARMLEALGRKSITLRGGDGPLLALEAAYCGQRAAGAPRRDPSQLPAPRPTLTGAQSVIDGPDGHAVLVYGFQYDGGTLYLSSAGEVLSLEDAREQYRIDAIPSYFSDPPRLSPARLRDIAGGAPAPDGGAIYAALVDLFQRHVSWPSPSLPALVATWTMATYVFQLFDFFPYLILTSATKRSGKSLVLEMLSHLAFNASTPEAIPTAATLYRDVHANSPTLLIDEAERLGAGAKEKEENADVHAVLAVGYARSGYVKRNEKGPDGAWVPARYRAYGPKALAAIREPIDILRDRAAVVRMRRKSRGETLQRFRPRQLRAPLATLRDDLHHWGLAHAASIAALETAMGGEADFFAFPESLDDRARDIYETLFCVAAEIDREAGVDLAVPALRTFVTEAMAQRQDDRGADTRTVKAVRALADWLGNASDRLLTTETAIGLFADAGLLEKLDPPSQENVTQAKLRDLGFCSKAHRVKAQEARLFVKADGTPKTHVRSYQITREKIDALQESYPDDDFDNAS